MIRQRILSVNAFFGKLFDGITPEVVEALKALSPRRVLFIDQPPSAGLVKAIRQLVVSLPGVELVLRDHHDVDGTPSTDRDQAIRTAADDVRQILGSNAVISTRKVHPACSSLISVSEFGDGTTVIIADNDADGLLGAMKAAGATYEALDTDAGILDGPRAQQTGLSALGMLFVKGLATLPPYDAKNPGSSDKARAELYTKFVEAAQGSSDATAWFTTKVEAYERGVAEAKRLLETVCEIAPGVWYTDTMSAAHYDLVTLAQGLESKPGCKITVVRKATGPIAAKHTGGQYSLAVVKAHQADINVQTYMPSGFVSSPESGTICNTGFLAHVSQKVWEEQVLPRLRAV